MSGLTISSAVLAFFLVFCRVGSCLMLMPGFASPRVPMQVRLFLALAVALSIAPWVSATHLPEPAELTATALGRVVGCEILVGGLFGLLGRCFFAALQFMAAGIAMFVGVGAMPGAQAVDDEPAPAIAALIMTLATVLIFLTDQHVAMLQVLIASYDVVPVSALFDAGHSLGQLSTVLGRAFVLALQVSGPFVVYALSVNFLFGLANKMTPQIPVYFISLPFVIAGGLLLMYWTLLDAMPIFNDGLSRWLAQG